MGVVQIAVLAKKRVPLWTSTEHSVDQLSTSLLFLEDGILREGSGCLRNRLQALVNAKTRQLND
jgi:hypothetical protein